MISNLTTKSAEGAETNLPIIKPAMYCLKIIEDSINYRYSTFRTFKDWLTPGCVCQPVDYCTGPPGYAIMKVVLISHAPEAVLVSKAENRFVQKHEILHEFTTKIIKSTHPIRIVAFMNQS
jgi:hypothetical protein